jgi:hypothetical protein
MAPQSNCSRRSLAAYAFAIAALATVAGLLIVLASPAEAQFFERRGRQQGFELFNPFGIFQSREPRDSRDYRDYREHRGYREYAPRESHSEPVDHSKAPPPSNSGTTPTKHIVVIGSSLSDWLAYGLEEIYADQPEVGVVRENHPHTGLVRYDSNDDTTWPQVVRKALKDQSADVIVVMLGLEDRRSIREQQQRPQQQTQQPPQQPQQRQTQQQQSFEFRTDAWADAYAKRIDEMIAAVKSKGVPVIWVGLPAIRGTRSTSDMLYLNDLFRARAERAGIVYVDVWDGFVNDAGRYATFGPDVEGQVRRLRTAEGVYFTEAGARKLAHYVERDIKDVMGTRLQPIATPTVNDSGQPAAAPGPAARPVAGPVVSLTNAAPHADELVGSGRRPGVTDPLAARVLVKGDAVAPTNGRADDFFVTPQGAEAAKAEATAVARTSPAAAPIADEPKVGEQGKAAHSAHPAKRPVTNAEPAHAARPRHTRPPRSSVRETERSAQRSQPSEERPRPPASLRNERVVEPKRRRPETFDPLGLFR